VSAGRHTPGPWQVSSPYTILAPTPPGVPCVLDTLPIADVYGPNPAADAALIAAAPQLLQAARDFVALAERSGWRVFPGSPLAHAAEAVRVAEGRAG
jgi:hypothetical protein